MVVSEKTINKLYFLLVVIGSAKYDVMSILIYVKKKKRKSINDWLQPVILRFPIFEHISQVLFL